MVPGTSERRKEAVLTNVWGMKVPFPKYLKLLLVSLYATIFPFTRAYVQTLIELTVCLPTASLFLR